MRYLILSLIVVGCATPNKDLVFFDSENNEVQGCGYQEMSQVWFNLCTLPIVKKLNTTKPIVVKYVGIRKGLVRKFDCNKNKQQMFWLNLCNQQKISN